MLLLALLLPMKSIAQEITDSLMSEVEKIIETGKRYLGKPYRYKADSGYHFDCSGYVSHVLLQHNIRLPRSSREMQKAVRQISYDQVKKGDLIFFKGRNSNSSTIGHVAMIVDDTPGALKMIHAASRGIVIDPYPTPYYKRRFVSVGRLPGFPVDSIPAPIDSLPVTSIPDSLNHHSLSAN
jgi:cell wall-associated NlpC family hydrolase